MSSPKIPVSYRNLLLISVLIAAVCFLTLTPAMYLAFHALQWKGALRILEIAFPPALLLAIAGGLLAYQRARARRAQWDHDEVTEAHSQSELPWQD